MSGRYFAAMALAVLASIGLGGAGAQQGAPAFTLDGDIALWTVAIEANK